MEMTKQEIAAVEQKTREVDDGVRELNELHLAFVGGGIGTVIVG